MLLNSCRSVTCCLLTVGWLLAFAAGVRAGEPVPPQGFTALFNSTDLTGWHGMPHFDPYQLDAMSEAQRRAQVEKWTDGTQFRYGGRVPCLVLSPYAKKGYVSKALHSHVSLVRFCEQNFGLPSLNARTAAADAMEDCFDLTQQPLPPPA